MQPSAEEQAWLDAQLATPRGPPSSTPSAEEQRWLDKQIQDAESADMLDDARQAGAQQRATRA
jgi:hypothetical protein